MREAKNPEDCADCLCRVCARSVHNDSTNSKMDEFDAGCCPCYYCDVNKEVIETDLDCERFLPDEDDAPTIPTDNGWYHINDKKPPYGKTVMVILERNESAGCSYMTSMQESTYRLSGIKGYFTGENEAWSVRYWREIEKLPYPNGVVKREVESCRNANMYPQILDYQKSLGYTYNENQ